MAISPKPTLRLLARNNLGIACHPTGTSEIRRDAPAVLHVESAHCVIAR
jgi:hypothetical protein